VEETQRDIAETGLLAPIVGHVGDGNFHVLISFDADDPDAVARVEAFTDRLVDRALSMDGTCTGEHGVGQKKIRFLEREHSPAALLAMRSIKAALDPEGIMNPGKVVVA
jgi:D-lactate dehydrogenase (cytochrome)